MATVGDAVDCVGDVAEAVAIEVAVNVGEFVPETVADFVAVPPAVSAAVGVGDPTPVWVAASEGDAVGVVVEVCVAVVVESVVAPEAVGDRPVGSAAAGV